MRIGMVGLGRMGARSGVALMMRFASQGSNDYAARLLAVMRAGLGGHAVQRDDGDGKVKGGG